MYDDGKGISLEALFPEDLLSACQLSVHEVLILMCFQIIYLCQDLRGKSRNLHIAQLGCWKSDSEFSAVDFSLLSFPIRLFKTAAAFQ